MKNPKFFLVVPVVAIVTLFSIYYTSNAESYSSKSADEIYTYSDSTQTHDGCCKSMEGCGNMKGSSNHDDMMMKQDKQEDEKNAGEHKHNDDTDVKKDDHSGCMGH
jgi:hypothetical protein